MNVIEDMMEALEVAEKALSTIAMQKTTDHVGDVWYTAEAAYAQGILPIIRSSLAKGRAALKAPV